MSPEFGSTCAIFPVDAETLRYLEFTGRPTEQIELVDAYTREQGLFHEPDSEDATYTDTLELDLGDVVPSIAGPEAPAGPDPARRTPSLRSSTRWRSGTPRRAKQLGNSRDEALEETLPGLDPPAEDHGNDAGKPRRRPARGRPPPSTETERRGRRHSSRAARRSSSTTATW